jgi:hypothetical protein
MLPLGCWIVPRRACVCGARVHYIRLSELHLDCIEQVEHRWIALNKWNTGGLHCGTQVDCIEQVKHRWIALNKWNTGGLH